MLNPKNNRLDYGELLIPPHGYDLDFAIGTTYSLDLDALVGACMSLGLSSETDSNLLKNPICLLEALKRTGDRIALFCEGGQIHLPNKVTPLYVLLEKMVFQVNKVNNAQKGKYPSFHPKFWLLRFCNDSKDVIYRIVVLSRNLTFDRSWDVAYYLEGSKSLNKSDKNAPVVDFVNFLTKHINDEVKIKKMKSIARELSNIRFNVNSDREFYDFDFIPTGIKKSSGGVHSIKDYPLFDDFPRGFNTKGLNELLIISPFLSKSVIRYFYNKNIYMSDTDYILITKTMSLENIEERYRNLFRTYIVKDTIVSGETTISSDEEEYRKQDIHAKVYLTRKGSDTDLYLGSLNATQNAIENNVEFMIRLRSKRGKMNIDTLANDLFCGREGDVSNPFMRVMWDNTSNYEETDSEKQLDLIVKQINRLNPTARITSNDTLYDIEVQFNNYSCDKEVYIRPLLSIKQMPVAEVVVFNRVNIDNLSEFYIIKVVDGDNVVERIIKIPTEGMPEDREKIIISQAVSDKASFYRYIAFLLGDDSILSALESEMEGEWNSEDGFTFKKEFQLPALYEKMLKTAYDNPSKLKEIDYLIQAIGDDGVVPEGFAEFYNTFKKVVKLE